MKETIITELKAIFEILNTIPMSGYTNMKKMTTCLEKLHILNKELEENYPETEKSDNDE